MYVSARHTVRMVAMGLGLMFGLMAASAAAQDSAAATPPAATVAPYEAELLRLSEILGAIHFLRTLCGQEDGTLWRDRMATLIEAEGADGTRRDRLTARFNRGYDTLSIGYRSCTANANAALDHYLAEGTRLTETLKTRFGS